MPRITVYLDETQFDYVKTKGPGFMRRLVQHHVTKESLTGQITTPGLKDCPRCHTLIPEKSEQHGKCGWKEKS